MANVLAQVAVPYRTGLPEDVSVNTWSFDVADTGSSSLGQIGAFLDTFYTAVIPYYSPVVVPANATLKMYDRAEPEPRTPIYEGTGFTTSTAPGIGLPEEVSVCMSFRGVLASGSPAARRRGRIYLGPLATDVLLLTDPLERSRVDPDFIGTVLDAYEAAWGELTGAGNVHEVWSAADGVGRPVVSVWMDNEFDTQRRRGTRATARTTRNGPF